MAKAIANCVAEWFGHRVYPEVCHQDAALRDQQTKRCPFLSEATGESRVCIKSASSLGVCTISSVSNGPRQDWLVCPLRGLTPPLLVDVVEHVFALPPAEQLVLAAPNLAKKEHRDRLLRHGRAGGRSVVYFQEKLGGEISLARTDRSPELSFDMTMVELLGNASGTLQIARYGIFELQTMDFHGSYRAAVRNLEDALRLHQAGFHDALVENQQWLGERIEGPNIANVFKRTFYQMMLKFQIGKQPLCAGTVLAIPRAVWDSWQRHLGRPELETIGDNYELRVPGTPPFSGRAPAWIYVFDVDADADQTPSPLVLTKRIATAAEAISHFALKVAPAAAVSAEGTVHLIPERIRQRMGQLWPEILQILT